MRWLSDYIFDPETFFNQAKNKNLNFILVLGGFLSSLFLHTTGYLILAIKNVKALNQSLENLDTTFQIPIMMVCGISILSSLNFGVIWLLVILYFICIDVIVRNENNYIYFAKMSALSFYCMTPYFLSILIFSILYTPQTVPSPMDSSYQSIASWSFESSQQIKNGRFYSIISNLEYFFDIWLITLLTVSYKSFSQQSYLFCCICAIIFIAMIIWLNLII